MACLHDLTEREIAVSADGYCPICLISELDELKENRQAELAAAYERGFLLGREQGYWEGRDEYEER